MPGVLVVDDESDVRLVARMILEDAGYDVEEAASGEDALRVLARTGADPDVLLLDVRMPGIDGWGVLDHLRRDPGSMPTLPVVVFTADIEAKQAAPIRLDHQHELFLAKPFDPEDLIRTISDAVALS